MSPYVVAGRVESVAMWWGKKTPPVPDEALRQEIGELREAISRLTAAIADTTVAIG